ncbi:hypothetical protein ACFQJ7_04585 [Halovenus rubra]|uniref:Uncharacterized protein n=2 Tax=Halovenus rubra TaxID=869890 RepID=A0ACC7DXX1_9EURY|nr:hypothetical protein [Halovenus rubra]
MSSVTENPGIIRAFRLFRSRAAILSIFVLVAHIVALLAYVHATGTVIAAERAMVPVVWITVAVWLVAHLRERGCQTNTGLFAPIVGVVYFFVLAIIGGVVGLGAETSSLAVEVSTPGWGPVVLGSLPPIRIVLLPFKVIGYIGLSYGVYRAVAATSRGAVAGILGLFACVSCTLPLIATAGSFLTGTTLALQTGEFTYDIATGVFVLTAVLLVVGVPTEQ